MIADKPPIPLRAEAPEDEEGRIRARQTLTEREQLKVANARRAARKKTRRELIAARAIALRETGRIP